MEKDLKAISLNLALNMEKRTIMTQEERELLLKDLCARLSYGVKVVYLATIYNVQYVDVKFGMVKLEGMPHAIDIGYIKPYLRPLSSMMEEEKDYIKNISRFKQSDGIHYDDGVHYIPIYQETLDDNWKTDGKLPPILGDIYRFMLDHGYVLLVDFFNSRHLDYRGLIPMGLALEAVEGMYVKKEEKK